MPHAVAAAVAAALASEDVQFAASGFRDATRIAAGDPRLWTSIVLANRVAVAAELKSVVDRCRELVTALEAADAVHIERLLAEGKRCRDLLGSGPV
jgi:prephenate dehydrogenase